MQGNVCNYKYRMEWNWSEGEMLGILLLLLDGNDTSITSQTFITPIYLP